MVVEGLVDILVDTVTEGTGDKPVKANCDAPKEDMAEEEASTLADTVTVNDVAVFDEVTLHSIRWMWKNVVWWLTRDKEQKISKMTNVLQDLSTHQLARWWRLMEFLWLKD